VPDRRAAAWLVAQVLENIQWESGLHAGDVLVYPSTVPVEEVLEISGSTLFGLGLPVVLRQVLRAGRRVSPA
jgi:hypothetical protein